MHQHLNWEEHICIFPAGASGEPLSLKDNVSKPPSYLGQVKTRAFKKCKYGS